MDRRGRPRRAKYDRLIAECYFYDAGRVGARRPILTHMSREMLARVADVPEQCAKTASW